MPYYMEAKIGGVPFKVSVADVEVGRRTVINEFPLRDIPYVEDIGRRSRTFAIDGFVIGDDWLAQADSLIAVAEQPGSKLLVHPVFGNLTVAITEPLRITYTLATQRIARFTMTCVNVANDRVELFRGTPATRQSVSDQIDAVFATASAIFNPQETQLYDYNYGRQSCWENALLRWRKMLASLRDLVQNIMSPITGFIDLLQGVVDGIEAFDRTLAGILTDAQQAALSFGGLLHDIGQLASGNFAVVDAAKFFWATCKASVAEGLSLIEAIQALFGVDQEIGNDNTAAQNNENADVEAIFMASAFAAFYAEALVYADWNDADQLAFYARDFAEVMDLVATALADIGDDATYHALDELRRLTVEYLDSIAPTLADVDTVTLTSGPRTALALAYELYEDVEREEDLLEANRTTIANPGFLPLNEPVSYLTA